MKYGASATTAQPMSNTSLQLVLLAEMRTLRL
jgi:hypothetical protein